MKQTLLGLLLLGAVGAQAQEVLRTSEEIRSQFAIIQEGEMYSSLQAVNIRLAKADGLLVTAELFDRLDSPMAIVAIDRHIFVPINTMLVIGNRPDEIAAVLAPLRILAKTGYAERQASATATDLNATSQREFSQAYLQAIGLMTKAGFNPTAMYSLQTRIEALSRHDPTSQIADLKTLYPPIAVTLESVLERTIQSQFGRDIRRVLIPTAKAASGDVLAEFDNRDPKVPSAYLAATGYPLNDENNHWVGYRQCPWWVAWARKDKIPYDPGHSNAWTWWDRLIGAGYSHFTDPRVGTIVVWNRQVGGGSGHVAMVTKVNSDGTFEVWDCNWGSEAKDKDPYNGRIRCRIVRDRENIFGFIGWPNGATQAPQGYLGYVEPGRSEIAIVQEEFHLGDDQPESQTIRTFGFELRGADLNDRRKATLEVWVKATPKKDPIFTVNTTEVGRVVAESDGWVEYQFTVPINALHVGSNAFIACSYTAGFDTGYDNCQVRGARLIFDK